MFNDNQELRIWLLQIGEQLPLEKDVPMMRTGHLALSLQSRGHEVIWWASAFNHFNKRWETKKTKKLTINQSIKIIALKGLGYKKNISLRRILDHLIVSLRFITHSRKAAKPDIIVASLPSNCLACAAVYYARKNKVPIVVDVRDPWPDIFRKYIPYNMRFIMKPFMYIEESLSRRALTGADALVSMMDTLLDWALLKIPREKRPEDRVFYLGGEKISRNIQMEDDLIPDLEKYFVVTYAGTFGKMNYPLTFLQCAKLINNENILFVMAGDGELYDYIYEESKDVSNLILTGWLDRRRLAGLLAHSNVGVCTARGNVEAFPNKVFAYFAAGLPVLMPYEGELRNIIERLQLGYYYKHDNPQQLAEYINLLSGNPRLYESIKRNVEEAFSELFDADIIYREYASYIEGFEKHRNDE